MTTGEAARLLSVSVQTVRNWVARGRLAAQVRGARTMIPREVVLAELERSKVHPRQVSLAAPIDEARQIGTEGPATPDEVPPGERIYWWMERARAEGLHFPLREHNARIPQDFLAEVMARPSGRIELAEPWMEHFRPAKEDDVFRLLARDE